MEATEPKETYARSTSDGRWHLALTTTPSHAQTACGKEEEPCDFFSTNPEYEDPTVFFCSVCIRKLGALKAH